MSVERQASYMTALNLLLENGSFSSDETGKEGSKGYLGYLDSGLPFSLYMLAGRNEREGTTFAAVAGKLEDLAQMPQGPLVRLHSACFYSEFGFNQPLLNWFKSRLREPSDFLILAGQHPPDTQCDCKAQREASQKMIAIEGGIYFDLLEQEGRGAGLDVKREAYRLHEEQGLDTFEAYDLLGVEADVREYGHCAQFLLDHGIQRVRLLSNNPSKGTAFTDVGITVALVPLVVGVTEKNKGYLDSKRRRGHRIKEEELNIKE